MLRLNHGDVFDGAVATGFPLYLNGADFPNNTYNDVQALWASYSSLRWQGKTY